jgi:dihydrofolate synthase/folylpolyglutamate synthase
MCPRNKDARARKKFLTLLKNSAEIMVSQDASKNTEQSVEQSVERLLEELFGLHRFTIKPGLERTRELSARVGNPQRTFAAVHVAGTNGKGTTCSVIASALHEAGVRVGLYTSPHVRRFNERMRVVGGEGGVEISDEELLRLAQTLMPHVRELGATFFEATTVLAFQWFAAQCVDVVVVETGMGGRLDSTNILEAEHLLATVITAIDYDHQEYLGNTLEAIANEKAGIIKAGVPCVLAEPRPELLAVFAERAAALQSPLVRLDEWGTVRVVAVHEDISMTTVLTMVSGSEFSSEGGSEFGSEGGSKSLSEQRLELRVPLWGDHQARNVLTALAACEVVWQRLAGRNLAQMPPQMPLQMLLQKPLQKPFERAFERGVHHLRRNTGLQARLERLRTVNAEQVVLLDVGHNPACVAALVTTLRHSPYAEWRWNVVFAAMQDKDVSQMLATLAPITKQMVTPSLAVQRAMSGEDLARNAREHGIRANAAATTYQALRGLLSSVQGASSKGASSKGASTESAEPVLIVGSFYLADEALQALSALRVLGT